MDLSTTCIALLFFLVDATGTCRSVHDKARSFTVRPRLKSAHSCGYGLGKNAPVIILEAVPKILDLRMRVAHTLEYGTIFRGQAQRKYLF